MILQGPIAAVNATLAAGVSYLGILNFHGDDTLTVIANDLGNTGAGGPLQDIASVAIHVQSPAEQIAQLASMVQGLQTQGVLNRGQANSLLVKL